MSEIQLTDEQLRAYAELTALGNGIVDHEKVFPAVVKEILETREFLRWLADLLKCAAKDGWVWDADELRRAGAQTASRHAFDPAVARWLAASARLTGDHLEPFGAHDPEETARIDEDTGARGDA